MSDTTAPGSGDHGRPVAGLRRRPRRRPAPERPGTLSGRLARGLVLTGLALGLGLILWAAGGVPVMEATR